MNGTYMSPSTCSIMTNERACGWTGVTSESPVDVSVVNDRHSSSNQGPQEAAGPAQPRGLVHGRYWTRTLPRRRVCRYSATVSA